MAAITDLELPSFDYADPTLKGERFHDAMRELREQSWIASMPLGFATLEREAGEFFLRSRAFTFPGMKIAEIFGIDDGPAVRGDPPQHPPHQRQGPLAPARAREPRVHPARDREVAAGDARLPDRAVGRHRRQPLQRRRGPLQALSDPGDRDRDGRVARRRRPAVGLVEPDPAPVRDERARGARRRSSRR